MYIFTAGDTIALAPIQYIAIQYNSAVVNPCYVDLIPFLLHFLFPLHTGMHILHML